MMEMLFTITKIRNLNINISPWQIPMILLWLLVVSVIQDHIKRVRHMTSRPIHGMKLLIVLVGKNTIFLISVLSINNTVNFYSIDRYATVTTSEGAIFIGGGTDVYLYNNSGWRRLDDLHTSRIWHRAIINGDKIYVIGGSGTQ